MYKFPKLFGDFWLIILFSRSDIPMKKLFDTFGQVGPCENFVLKFGMSPFALISFQWQHSMIRLLLFSKDDNHTGLPKGFSVTENFLSYVKIALNGRVAFENALRTETSETNLHAREKNFEKQMNASIDYGYECVNLILI